MNMSYERAHIHMCICIHKYHVHEHVQKLAYERVHEGMFMSIVQVTLRFFDYTKVQFRKSVFAYLMKMKPSIGGDPLHLAKHLCEIVEGAGPVLHM